MLIPLLLALLQAPSPGGRSPATIEVTPRSAAVRAGDTLRLCARVLDALARPPSDVPIVWRATGEGTVDQTGLVRAGYAGYVRVTATVGGATFRTTVIVHPRPTSSVEIRPVVRRMVAGSRVTLNGWAFSPELGQGREIAWLPTADSLGMRPLQPMARGVVVRKGLIYAIDANSGLWIVRQVPRRGS